jgi:hypothetical protein
MSQELSLKQIERKAWLTVFEDGLYDIFLGWLILWLGVIFTLSQSSLPDLLETVINLGVYLGSVALLRLGKRAITLPRIGQVKFGQRRRSRLTMAGVITFVLVALTFSLTLLAVVRDHSLLGASLSPLVGPLLLGLFFLVFFGIAAYFLEYKRLYLIAVMFALPEPAMAIFRQFWGINLGFWAFAVPAAVVIVMGLVILLRFLQEHPAPAIPTGEMSHGQS